jgi:tRNA 2-selenouridine synthase
VPTSVNINEFLKLSEQHPILDVRTAAEFVQGHIPGAINLPLFTNEERVIVGTLYKKEGKQPAVLKGLEIVGPKLSDYIRQAITHNKSGTFLVHCWRGGMRSSSMAWFLETYGFKCITLQGGYKSFRNHVLKSFNEQKNILILSGKTGSGKTPILHELQKTGEQIIDLEQLAHHKGSSFGALGEEKQNSQEQFENELSFEFSKLDNQKKCWLEDESRRIGANVIPEGLWNQMRVAKVIYIEIPIEDRVKRIVEEYGNFSKDELISAIERIAKRLGGQHVKRAIDAICVGDTASAFEICLVYYDKTYRFGIEQREELQISHFTFNELNIGKIARKIKTVQS